MKFGSDSVSSVEYLQYLSIRFSPSIFLEFYSSGIKKNFSITMENYFN